MGSCQYEWVVMRKFIKYKDVYMVSSVGEVWKIENNKLIPKKLSPSKVGYLVTSINNKIEYVHRIVMTAFCGNSEKHVDHINMNKHDNRLENLEYVTPKENNLRAYEILGSEVRAGKSIPVKWNGKVYKSGAELSSLLGMDRSAVCVSIRKNRPIKGHYAKKIKN